MITLGTSATIPPNTRGEACRFPSLVGEGTGDGTVSPVPSEGGGGRRRAAEPTPFIASGARIPRPPSLTLVRSFGACPALPPSWGRNGLYYYYPLPVLP